MSKQSNKVFWQNVSLVFSGTVVAQVIPILGSLIIARLFVPDAFGQFAIWLGFVLMFAVICTGRYEMSLPVEEDGEPRILGIAANLFVVTIISIIAIFFTSIFIYFGIKFGMSNTQLFLIVPTGALMGTMNIWQTWAAAEGKFPSLSNVW